MPNVNTRVEQIALGTQPNNTTSVAFHGTSTADQKGGAVFDDFEPTHQAQSTSEAIRAADVPVLFRLRIPNHLGTSQPNHCANDVNGILRAPVVRHTLDFGTKRVEKFEHIDAQVSAQRVFFTPLTDKAGADQVTSFDVKTGNVSSLNLSPKAISTQCTIATDLGFAVAWTEADETGSDQQFISHIDAHTNTVLWTKAVSNKSGLVKFMQQTASGDIVALCNGEKGFLSEKMKLCRLDHTTGESIGPQSNTCIEGFWPIVSSRGKEHIFYCDENGESLVIAFCSSTNDESRLYAVDFINQEVRKIVDLPFSWVHFKMHSQSNGRAIFLKNGFGGMGHRVTIDAEGSFKIDSDSINLEQVPLCVTPLISNTNGNFAVRLDQSGTFSFFRTTPQRVELISSVTKRNGLVNSIGLPQPYIAMTKDDVAYYSEVTALDDEKCECRLRAFNAPTGQMLWSIEKTFDGPANLAVNDDGSISWFTANGGFIYAAP